MNKEPISRNGTRLHKDDVVRVLECCNCKCCTPFKGSLATITATQDEDEWLRPKPKEGGLRRVRQPHLQGGKKPILRLKMASNRTSCCFRACNVNFVSRTPTGNQVYIDHIYNRVTQNITPEEVIILAARLHAFADTQ